MTKARQITKKSILISLAVLFAAAAALFVFAFFGAETTVATAASSYTYVEEGGFWQYRFLHKENWSYTASTKSKETYWSAYLRFKKEPSSAAPYFDVAPYEVEFVIPCGEEYYVSSAATTYSNIPFLTMYICDSGEKESDEYLAKLSKTSGREDETVSVTLSYEFFEGSFSIKYRNGYVMSEIQDDGETSATEWSAEPYTYYDFFVDFTPPTVVASENYVRCGDGEMRYSNADVEIFASDNIALDGIYVKAPGDEYFSKTDCSAAASAALVVSASGGDGEYLFYVSDMCDRCSDVYSFYIDTTPPVVTVMENEDTFTIEAFDASGTAAIYDENGEALGERYELKKDFLGTKTFYAADAAGNLSEIVSVSIVLTYPAGALFCTEDESYYFVWDDPGGWALLDDEPYEMGSVVSVEGCHEIEFVTSDGDAYFYDFEIGHFFVLTDASEASCYGEGYEKYVCSHCGKEYEKTFEKTEHKYVEYVSSATCEKGGYIRYTCIYCGDSYDVETSSPTGHLYLPASASATCTTPGGTVYTCIYCGDIYTVGDATLANHEYVTVEIVSATCEEYGFRVLVCANCGDEREDILAPLGHDYYLFEEKKDDDGDIIRTYTCSRCGDSYEVNIGNTQNETAKALISLFDTYSDYMWWILLACAGVWSLFMGIRYALATREEEREKARRTISNYLVGLVVIAVILVAAPYLIYGVAVLLS